MTLTSDPWRLECPAGHRAIRVRHGSIECPGKHWYCHTCQEGYDTVTDLKENRDVSVTGIRP